ncbi:MAG TPA: DNA sulfur modification protein DndB [Acidimicrobiia bacterium]|jgi:DNA sulfur modification protein DndB
MTDFTTFDPARGVHVKGLPLTPTSFTAVTTFDQLSTITRPPSDLQEGIRRSGYDAEAVAEEAELHSMIQRAMTGAKKRNVKNYALYIRAVVLGLRPGVLPPIHLWSMPELDMVTVGPNNFLVVPNGERTMAIDGETQLESHYQAHQDLPPEGKDMHGTFPLAIVIHHGIDVPTARQLFHDLNVLAVRPNVSLSLNMDSSDPLMRIVDHLEAVPPLLNRVEHQKRQLPKTSSKLLTTQTLRQMVINVAKGVGGVQFGARPAPVEGLNLDDVESVAQAWIGAYFNEFAAQILDRETTIAGSPAILAAVGAMGNIVLHTEPTERSAKEAELISLLRKVNWTKGEHWVGIAGAMKAKGFSVNSPKEAAYNIFGALTDSSNINYNRVRMTISPV